MGFFDFLRSNSSSNGAEQPADTVQLPEIPEKVFIETENKQDATQQAEPDPAFNNIEMLFRFLEHNYESEGYDDALRNPDSVHMQQNIDALKYDLFRTIKRVKTFYEDFIKEIDFHIESRSRSGLLDTVDEMKMKKEIAESHIKKVIEIEKDAQENKGDAQGMIISYTRGFKNGLAAISHHKILGKKF